jgi:hypothetical protein
MDMMAFIEQHQASDRTNAWHRWPSLQRLWIMRPRGGHDMPLEIPDEPIVIVDQGQIDVDVFLHRGIGKA